MRHIPDEELHAYLDQALSRCLLDEVLALFERHSLLQLGNRSHEVRPALFHSLRNFEVDRNP